ncbi:MAG: GTP-binding protein [Sarcina sp.]
MKIDIISGFLGAGKTTLIKKLINEELNKEKIAIIENEYGEIGIDGDILKNSGLEVKEITSGCICCNITGDFTECLKEIISEYRPERVIIEPSGVAKLSQIIESIKQANIKGSRINMKIAVVDAQNVELYIKNFGEFYKNQIINANTIILSRSNKLTEKNLEKACNIIKKINNKGTIITSYWGDLTSKRILEVGENKVEQLVNNTVFKMPINLKKSRAIATDIFENWGIETAKSFSMNKIKVVLQQIQKQSLYGEVIRVKGIVKGNDRSWIKFDYVPNDFKVEEYEMDYTGRICVIGKELNKKNIEKLFLE